MPPSSDPVAHPAKLLVLDTSYTFEMIRARGLEDSVTCRDLGGFFSHVWTVHPFATLLTSSEWTKKYGAPQSHKVNARHTFIEGKVGFFSGLRWLFFVNFLLGQLRLFAALVRLIRRERISVIRAGDPLYLGLFAWALAKACGIPFLVRVGANHDKIFATTAIPMQPRLLRSRGVEKWIERFVFTRADLVAGANKDNLGFALANGARPERATLFRYGNLIDKRHFSDPLERRRASQRDLDAIGVGDAQFLLYIGRLEPVKHPDDVVRALALARTMGHDVSAILVGDGSLRPALADLAASLGVAQWLILAGNRDQGWLSSIIPCAAVVVSPHTGRALSEAALGAAPVVAYDIDWQGELIETGQTGYLVPHPDSDALAHAVVQLLDDRHLAARLGRNLRQRALEMLDPATLDDHERHQYSRLLEMRNTAPITPSPPVQPD